MKAKAKKRVTVRERYSARDDIAKLREEIISVHANLSGIQAAAVSRHQKDCMHIATIMRAVNDSVQELHKLALNKVPTTPQIDGSALASAISRHANLNCGENND